MIGYKDEKNYKEILSSLSFLCSSNIGAIVLNTVE